MMLERGAFPVIPHQRSVEALCSCQGIEARAPLTTSPKLAKVILRRRADVPPLEEDRYLAPDIQKAAELVSSGALVRAAV
jgi:histidine ammonia-lyase